MTRTSVDPDATFDALFASAPKWVEEATLTYFVQAISTSDALNPRSWCVYALSDRVRLLMGNLIVATITRGHIWVCLDGRTLDSDAGVVELLDTPNGFRWDRDDHPEYKPVPSRNAYLDCESASPKTVETVWRLHRAFLVSVGMKYKSLSARSVPSHDERVLRAIEQRLASSEALPEPEFDRHRGWEFDDADEGLGPVPTVATTEREAVVLSRRGQGVFRTNVKRRWSNRCAVTGCGHVSLLIASHIKPWRVASDRERLDPANGLLLTPSIDALFDAGLITFDDAGAIVESTQVSASDLASLGVRGDSRLVSIDDSTREYLIYHREHVFSLGALQP